MKETDAIKNETDVRCVRLVPKDKDVSQLSFVSFKIVVPLELFESIKDPALWPSYVAVREFVESPPRRTPVTSIREAPRKRQKANISPSPANGNADPKSKIDKSSNEKCHENLTEINASKPNEDVSVVSEVNHSTASVEMMDSSSTQTPLIAALDGFRSQDTTMNIDLTNERVPKN